MSIKQKILFVLLVVLPGGILQIGAQTRITLGDRPKVNAVEAGERPSSSTKYSEAEEKKYLSLITSAYRQLLADSMLKAEKLFVEAVDFLPGHPSNAEAYFQLGCIAEQKEVYEDALEYYRKALRINENLAKV